MATNGSLPRKARVADIGGTNARFAITDLGTLQLSSSTSPRCAEFASLQAVVTAYLDAVVERLVTAAVAVAAPVLGESVQFTNSSWSFEQQELRTSLAVQSLLVLNDHRDVAPPLGHELWHDRQLCPPPGSQKLVNLRPGQTAPA
jgi:glucokinase